MRFKNRETVNKVIFGVVYIHQQTNLKVFEYLSFYAYLVIECVNDNTCSMKPLSFFSYYDHSHTFYDTFYTPVIVSFEQ